ncbi:hypothetical protein [Lentzea sp. NPDC092896]|uniref:hypothetical protein n=1 Tax=Lentzea sp. NPDC092896 TaxID=3364127 RepID=UPI0038052D8B
MPTTNPHPAPILLENYGHIAPGTTLHEMLSHLVDVAGVLGRDGVLPESPYLPWPDQISRSLAGQLIQWVRETKPTCGARDQEQGSTPNEFFECRQPAFHDGDHQDGNASWPA